MATKDFQNIMDMYFQQTKPSKSTTETKVTVKEVEVKPEEVKEEVKVEEVKTEEVKKVEVKKEEKKASTPKSSSSSGNKGGRKPYKDSDGTPPVRLNTKLYNGNYDYCLQKGMEAGIKPCNAISYYINHLIDIDKKKNAAKAE